MKEPDESDGVLWRNSWTVMSATTLPRNDNGGGEALRRNDDNMMEAYSTS